MKRGNLKQVRESYSGIEPGRNGVKRSFINASSLSKSFPVWSEAEISTLRRLVSNGVPYRDIAFILGRTYKAVATKAFDLSLTKSSFYTPEEDRFIRFYAGKKSVGEIASLLGRSYLGIQDYCFRHKILMHRYSDFHYLTKLTEHDVDLIRSLREEGLTLREIALKFDVSLGHVRDICVFNKRFKNYCSESERYKFMPFTRK
ncbi:TPA: hypothetical protein JWH76_004748 [Escherichia coli]|nr:hypothetical protein [Escherichia coli]